MEKNISYFFVTPHKTSAFGKLLTWSKPDCYIFDLQDGCPKKMKSLARENLMKNSELITSIDAKIVLRINSFANQSEYSEDLKLLEYDFIDTVMLPSICDIQEVKATHDHIDRINKKRKRPLTLIPLIETVYSLQNLNKIIRVSDKIEAVALGLYDMFADLDAQMSNANLKHVINRVMITTKGHNLPFIDSPYVDVHNYAGLFKNCEKAVESGADGKMILHPDHIDIIHQYFSIDEKERVELQTIIDQYDGGCDISIDGKFIGPPLARMIRNKLGKKTKKVKLPSKGVLPIVFKYGLDLDRVFEGQIIRCPYDITMDDSWTTTWSSLVSMSNFIETSDAFAQSAGLKRKVMPFSAVLNLTLCMAVETYSESCLLHLGLTDVTYENPAYSGDSFKCYIHVKKIRNTSDGKRSVIESTHVLVNQLGERILSFGRNTLFPYIHNLDERIGANSNEDISEIVCSGAKTNLLEYLKPLSIDLNHIQQRSVEKNDLLIHDANRFIGESENLSFTTLFRNTHPVHFNYLRFAKNEIIVCGGFVMAIALSNALKDLKQVLHQEIITCSHINKITPTDTISSVSFVHDISRIDNYEVITLKTLGLINIDASIELINREWPISLFSKDDLRPAMIESILQKEMPELYHRICVQILWKIWRPCGEIS